MNSLGTLFSEIKSDLTTFLTLKMKMFQLDMYEKSGRAFSLILFGLIVSLVVFFAVLFLFLALAFFLGDLLGSLALGLGIVAIVYVLFIVLLIVNRNQIQLKLLNLFLTEITKNDSDYEGE